MSSGTREQKRLLYERLIGTVLADKFTITGLLGFGGMGAVYEARQHPMDRQVALKLIPTYDPTAAARFEREAYTVSKLRHPNTVTVFDFGQTGDGHLYLSMEHLEGRTLTDLVRAEGPLDGKRTVHIAQQICRSLGEAHRQGIIHRDVKPDNIFLITVDGDPDYVKVLDFGIAKAVHGEEDVNLTAEGRIIGTPRYMSPEQILAQPVDHRSDLYSLGCIIFEMMCGSPPFEHQSTAALMMSHAQQAPPTFAERLGPGYSQQLPPGIEHVVRRTMAKNPNARPRTTDELRAELEHALHHTGAYPGVGTHETNQLARPPMAHPSQTGPHAHHPTGPTPRIHTEPGSQTGGFDQFTGDFSRQTGDFPSRQQHHQHATAQELDSSEPARDRTNNNRVLMVCIALLAVGMIGALTYIMSQGEAQAPKPVTRAPEISAVSEPIKEVAPRTQTLLVTSPAGASVSVDGKKLEGVTPLRLEVKPGDEVRTYRFELEGHSSGAVTIDPEALQATYTRALDPKAPGAKREEPRATKRPTKRTTPRKNNDPPKESTPKVVETTPVPVEVKVTTPKKPVVDKLDDEDSISIERLD